MNGIFGWWGFREFFFFVVVVVQTLHLSSCSVIFLSTWLCCYLRHLASEQCCTRTEYVRGLCWLCYIGGSFFSLPNHSGRLLKECCLGQYPVDGILPACPCSLFILGHSLDKVAERPHSPLESLFHDYGLALPLCGFWTRTKQALPRPVLPS